MPVNSISSAFFLSFFLSLCIEILRGKFMLFFPSWEKQFPSNFVDQMISNERTFRNSPCCSSFPLEGGDLPLPWKEETSKIWTIKMELQRKDLKKIIKAFVKSNFCTSHPLFLLFFFQSWVFFVQSLFSSSCPTRHLKHAKFVTVFTKLLFLPPLQCASIKYDKFLDYFERLKR